MVYPEAKFKFTGYIRNWLFTKNNIDLFILSYILLYNYISHGYTTSVTEDNYGTGSSNPAC